MLADRLLLPDQGAGSVPGYTISKGETGLKPSTHPGRIGKVNWVVGMGGDGAGHPVPDLRHVHRRVAGDEAGHRIDVAQVLGFFVLTLALLLAALTTASSGWR